MKTLDNKVALVTGAGSGIGKAIALGLAEKGVSLCLLGRSDESLKKVCSAAQEKSPKVFCIQCDITSDSETDRIPALVHDQCGGLDILVHSAGTYSMGDLENSTTRDFDLLLRTNTIGPFKLTQCLVPMLKKSHGDIVFINSSAGLSAARGVAQYAASKHALKALADSLRAELNSSGVRVLSVYPGRTATPMQLGIHLQEGKKYTPEQLLQPEDIAAIVICALELSATAEVTDISIRPKNKT